MNAKGDIHQYCSCNNQVPVLECEIAQLTVMLAQASFHMCKILCTCLRGWTANTFYIWGKGFRKYLRVSFWRVYLAGVKKSLKYKV